MPPKPKPIPPKRDNPLKNKKEIRAPTIFTQRAAAAAAEAQKNRPTRQVTGCGDPECDNPVIVDGVCQGCGKVVDDSNIVAEVQFGESGSGAAIVQGSYIGADQGGVRTSGPGYPRAGGSEEGREGTIKEGKRILHAMASQLGIGQQDRIDRGYQIFKLAAMSNFVQGRRMDMVCAVCLYSACRQMSPCKVMLIDFADRLQVNVFKLGRTFKALHQVVSFAKTGIMPILPEDLIWRFAHKLEFGQDTNKVAEDAVRMVQRMSVDWMVMGRRPSGVCGACLILAARMNNYRRSITEVVYVVKVTTHTIQKRLEEFKMTPSSALTVDEFLNNEFLEVAHDPPSFYEKTEEFQKTKKRRKRRRKDGDEEDNEETASQDGENHTDKRQRTGETSSADKVLPMTELRRDADGFAIPPPPQTRSESQNTEQEVPIDPDLVDEIISDHTNTSFQKLVDQFGDAQPDYDDDEEPPSGLSITNPRKGPDNRPIYVPPQWQRAEEQLEKEMTEVISDPNTIEHAVHYAEAAGRVEKHMAEFLLTQRDIPSSEEIDDGEFADDPEVQNCKLTADEVAKKEKMWVNANKSWLRKQQIKEYKRKQEAKGPPKARRIRKKKPRYGEGQTSAASTPQEAVEQVMKVRGFSARFNYDAFHSLFDSDQRAGLGSATTSRAASRAGSETPVTPVTPATPSRQPTNEDAEMVDAEDDYDNPDDYIDPDAEGSVQAESVAGDEEPRENWKAALGYGDEDDEGAFDGPEDYDDE